MEKPHVILAVDTSTAVAGYALVKGEAAIAVIEAESTTAHSHTIFNNLSTLFSVAGMGPEDVDGLIAVTGPGSFTGLRVGLAAVKGLAATLGKPALGVDRLDLQSLNTGIAALHLVLLDAGRGEVYGGLREVDAGGEVQKLGRDMVGNPVTVLTSMAIPDRATNMIVCGDGARKYQSILTGLLSETGKSINVVLRAELDLDGWQLIAEAHPSTATLGKYGARLLEVGTLPEMHAYYIRQSDAEIKAS